MLKSIAGYIAGPRFIIEQQLKKQIMKNVASYLVFGYLVLTQIFTLIFWVEIVREHTIIYAFTVGFLEAEFKGILFPFFY